MQHEPYHEVRDSETKDSRREENEPGPEVDCAAQEGAAEPTRQPQLVSKPKAQKPQSTMKTTVAATTIRAFLVASAMASPRRGAEPRFDLVGIIHHSASGQRGRSADPRQLLAEGQIAAQAG